MEATLSGTDGSFDHTPGKIANFPTLSCEFSVVNRPIAADMGLRGNASGYSSLAYLVWRAAAGACPSPIPRSCGEIMRTL